MIYYVKLSVVVRIIHRDESIKTRKMTRKMIIPINIILLFRTNNKKNSQKSDFEEETEQLLLRTALTNYGQHNQSNILSAMDDESDYNK